MVLGTRGSMDPRFAWYGRLPARGAMQAIVNVRHIVTVTDLPDTSWTPFGTVPDAASPYTDDMIYRGPARISPNVDWRARKQKEPAEIVSEHAVHIELDFNGNVVGDGSFPEIAVGDWLFVERVQQWGGKQASTDLTKFTYVVRNIAESSQSWVKTLLCDITPNHESEA